MPGRSGVKILASRFPSRPDGLPVPQPRAAGLQALMWHTRPRVCIGMSIGILVSYLRCGWGRGYRTILVRSFA